MVSVMPCVASAGTLPTTSTDRGWSTGANLTLTRLDETDSTVASPEDCSSRNALRKLIVPENWPQFCL